MLTPLILMFGVNFRFSAITVPHRNCYPALNGGGDLFCALSYMYFGHTKFWAMLKVGASVLAVSLV